MIILINMCLFFNELDASTNMSQKRDSISKEMDKILEVHFLIDETNALIYESWLVKDAEDGLCYYPPAGLRTRALKKKSKPDPNNKKEKDRWTAFEINIIKTHGKNIYSFYICV